MTGFTMQLPAPIWSTNGDRNLHHFERAERIKLWKEAAMVGYKNAYGKRAQEPGVVALTLPVPDRRKRDPHNFCGTVVKAVIDGLVRGGAWPDDTPDYVGHREPVFRVTKDRIVVVEWLPKERTEHEGMDIGDSHLPIAG